MPTIASTEATRLHVDVSVRSFRAFRDEASFRLRPLTLLYGHNQAGKSSLLRLVPLLSDSMRPGVPGLNLRSPSLLGATFKELGWMGREPSFSPWIKLRATAEAPAPSFVLQLSDDGGLVANRVQLFLDHGSRDKFVVSLDGDVQRGADKVSARYAGTYKGVEWAGDLSFSQLFPEGLPAEAQGIADRVIAALAPLARTRWLHASRLVDRSGTVGGAPDGSDLARTLRDPRYRGVLDAASQWLSAQGGLGSDIAIHPDSDGQPRFVIGFSGREYLPLHLAGEGVRALVPLLLHACWAEQGRAAGDTSTTSLLAIEEPEAHLHPHLQVALFQRLLATVQAGVPVVLETHSVYVLRAMQIAVLRGDLAPNDIGLHWVEQDSEGASSVTPIEVHDDAALEGWRPAVFEQEQDLAHELMDLRWKRLETSA